MQPEIVSRLVEINREFYQQFAASFDQTRQRIQPGVAGLLDTILEAKRILDIGFGNGELLETLHKAGFKGEYTGLDFSAELVSLARQRCPVDANATFLVRDLADSDWAEGLAKGFDLILAFAVFHHLPAPLPGKIFATARQFLAPGGKFMHSNWQFLNSARWRKRVQPWTAVNIQPESVGPNDYLLDWRRGGTGFRYVHYFTEEELAQIAARSRFEIEKTFYSDGKEGNLALYQIWTPI